METHTTFLKNIEIYICDYFKLNKGEKDSDDFTMMNIINNLIELFEIIFTNLRRNKVSCLALYNFYYGIQFKLIKNYTLTSESNKKKYINNFYNNDLGSSLEKYKSKFAQHFEFVERIYKIFYNTDMSLIYKNWLIFICK